MGNTPENLPDIGLSDVVTYVISTPSQYTKEAVNLSVNLQAIKHYSVKGMERNARFLIRKV